MDKWNWFEKVLGFLVAWIFIGTAVVLTRAAIDPSVFQHVCG
ncbi:hypothetical protein LCGC14_2600480 [marine sediment metagenome]|uniref:Uncharacterized protein n=1 Tax=marine sediment metagenome TaxID=412755 RepID=A0A0F9AWL0_9ZZZZ